MTALNCFVTPDAVHIATDGAGYRTDGTPHGQNQKVSILAHLPAVIAARGSVALVHMLGASIATSLQSFDELLADAPMHFRSGLEKYLGEMRGLGLYDVAPKEAQFVIAGYSQARGRLEAYTLNSASWAGNDPWTLCPIPEDLISPIDERVIEAIGEIANDVGSSADAPEAWALRLMEAQRACPFETEAGRSIIAVGGFCQLTTLTRDGVNTRIMRRWPDAIGERMSPGNGDLLPVLGCALDHPSVR